MDTSKINEMLSALENERRVTKWEMNFIEETGEQFDDKGRIPQWRYDKLEELYSKYK